MKTIAVTGANRGLGYALVKRLAKESKKYQNIILWSRDVRKGEEAVFNLRSEIEKEFETNKSISSDLQDLYRSKQIFVSELDTSDSNSIQKFCSRIRDDELWGNNSTIGIQKNSIKQLDAIVNNAGVLIQEKIMPKASERLFQTASTNLFGIIELNQAILSKNLLSSPEGMIINISSKLATSAGIRDAELKDIVKKISSIEDLYVAYEALSQKIQDMENSKENAGTKIGDLFSKNFPFAEYSFLKLLLSKYTYILAESSGRNHSIETEKPERKHFEAYSVWPGWCRTDMGGSMATSSADDGTNTTFWLLENNDLPKEMSGTLVYGPKKFIKL